MRFHYLQNVQTALNFLEYRKIKLVNIRPDDIVDSNQKLILGLIWTIILHFMVSLPLLFNIIGGYLKYGLIIDKKNCFLTFI